MLRLWMCTIDNYSIVEKRTDRYFARLRNIWCKQKSHLGIWRAKHLLCKLQHPLVVSSFS